MPKRDFTHSLQLPELKIVEAIKVSNFEVCPKCAIPSKTVYDHVSVLPIRDKQIFLKIKKRRFF